jgi:hypothetical protein
MQDLMQSYASDLNKLRDAFHNELTATAEELSKAMAFYASRSDAALASFMEKATTRGKELEGAAAARLNQFCGLPANGAQPSVDDEPPNTLKDSAALKIAAFGERAVADGLHVDSDRDRKPQPARSIPRSNQGRPLEASHLQLQEAGTETAHSEQGENRLLA